MGPSPSTTSRPPRTLRGWLLHLAWEGDKGAIRNPIEVLLGDEWYRIPTTVNVADEVSWSGSLRT